MALADEDYAALTTTNAVFASGASGADLTQTLSIPITDDGLDEVDETFTVDFGTLPDSVSAGTPATVTVTITDDDVPAVSFTAATASVSESAGTATVTVQLSASPATQITIPVRTENGVALADEDYTALTTINAVFASGASGADLTQTISIPITDDGLDESHEPFTVAFGTLPDSVSAGTPAAVTVTIIDDDVVTVSFVEETVSVREDAGTATVTVQLNMPPIVPVFIPVLTTNGTAAANEDYRERGLSTADILFAAGASGADLRQTVNIRIIDDHLYEDDETFTVSFGTLLAGSVSAGTPDSVTVTITETDADLPELSVSASPIAINEGETSTITITVTTGVPLRSELTVPFTISGAGITAGDYTLAGTVGTAVTLPAASTGQRTVPALTLTLTATDDADTSVEMLTFTLASGAGYTVSSSAGSALVAIKPTGTPTLEFTTDAVSVTETPGGRTVTMEMRLSGPPVNDLVVPVSTTDGTATAGADYTALSADIVFASGATGAALTQTVQVEITDDRVDEPSEDFTIAFSPLLADSSGVYSVTVTIVDEDIPELSVSISRDSINEGEEATIRIISDIVIGDISFDQILRYEVRGDDITDSDYILTTDYTRRLTDQGSYLLHTLTLMALPDGDDLERLTFLVTPADIQLYTVSPSNGSVMLTINPAGTPPLPKVEFGTSYFLAPESTGGRQGCPFKWIYLRWAMW